jgi:beta-phosphoglucomutase family hydrolase
VTALLFDLDGVLTSTAVIHSQAWKQSFDTFLATYADATDDQRRPFSQDDYLAYVDGRSRDDGISSFLRSRDIRLPHGDPTDVSTDGSVTGIGNTKNALFLELLDKQGAQAYPDAVTYLKAAHKLPLKIAVVTSSKNGEQILEATGLRDFISARIDGKVIAERGLPGKPAPDSFLAGAEALGVTAKEAVVFEDAVSGVQAGHAGEFGFVVGVDRTGGDTHGKQLRSGGADVVVTALTELLENP